MAEPQSNEVVLKGNNEVFETLTAIINVSAAGDNTIVAARAGRKIRVLGIMMVCADLVSTTWKSDSDAVTDAYGNTISQKSWAKNGGMSDLWGPWCWFFETQAGEALKLHLSGSVQVTGFVSFILV